MPRWFDSFVDSQLQRLGYVKDVGGTAPIFAGETRASALINFDDFSSEQMEKLAVTSAWVWSDIQAITNEASAAPLHVMETMGDKGTEEVTNHPFELIWRRPNQDGKISGAYLRRYTLWWWLLRGEAYLFKKFDGAGDLIELQPIPASRMMPIPHPTEYIGGFKYQPIEGRKPIVLLPEQVVFFRFPNPFDYHRGMSPMSAFKMAVQSDVAAAKWNLDTFNSGAALQMLISLPKELSPTEYTKRKGEILEEMLEKQRRFLIARAGDIAAEKLGMTHSDAEFLAGRTFNREEIDRVYGIPAGYWAKDANRANAEAAKATMIEQAVWPLLRLMGEEITAQVVIPEYGDEYVAQFEDIRPRDRRLIIDERRQNWQVMKVSEARADLGLDPLGSPIDEMLVPNASRPALGSGIPSPIMSVLGGKSTDRTELTDGGSKDLKRWRSIALRRFREDGNAAGYDFESDEIPPAVKAEIELLLSWATSEEEVKAAFAAPFCNPHTASPASGGGESGDHGGDEWAGYP